MYTYTTSTMVDCHAKLQQSFRDFIRNVLGEREGLFADFILHEFDAPEEAHSAHVTNMLVRQDFLPKK